MNERDELEKDKALKPIDRVKRLRDLWLVEESDCPFATLHSLMNYGFVAAKQLIGEGKIRWSKDKGTMLFRGHLVDINGWKQSVIDLLTTAENMLAKDLMFSRDGRLPTVNRWNTDDDETRRRRVLLWA